MAEDTKQLLGLFLMATVIVAIGNMSMLAKHYIDRAYPATEVSSEP